MSIDKVYEKIQNNGIEVVHFGLPNIKSVSVESDSRYGIFINHKEIEKSKVAETKMAEVFDDKVSTAMIRDGLNPYDEKQTNEFLQTERGMQYANEHNSAIESIRSNLEEYTRTQWSLYDEKSKEIREQVLSGLKDSMNVDNGVLSYVSKIKDESGEWVNELVQVYVRDALRQRLSDAKEILEEDKKQEQPLFLLLQIRF